MGANKNNLPWLALLAVLAVACVEAPAQAQSTQKQDYSAPKLPAFIDRRRLPDLEAVTAEAEAKRKAEAEAEAKRKAEADAKRKVEEERRVAAEAEAKRKADEERRLAAEADAKRKAEDDRRQAAEAEAKRKAEEERRQAAEAETKRKAEEERRQAAEAEAKRKAEEERRLAAEAAAKRKAEEERRQAAEAEAKRKAEEEQRQAAAVRVQAAASPTTEQATDGSPLSPPTVARLGVPPSPRGASCGPVKATASPVPGGRVSLTIESACRAGQKASIGYGDFEFIGVLDGAGRYTMLLDLFLGSQQKTATVSFGGEAVQNVYLEAPDLDQVSKVALIWKRPVNLDLHAFEYAAARGQQGHVWAGQPASADAALTQARNSGRGAGFLSSIDDGRHEGDKAEVYTFWHNAEQTSGNIGFALDYETRGSEPRGETCEGGADAEVAFDIVVLGQRGTVQRESGLIKSAKCGEPLAERARYSAGAVPDLRIRR